MKKEQSVSIVMTACQEPDEDAEEEFCETDPDEIEKFLKDTVMVTVLNNDFYKREGYDKTDVIEKRATLRK